jgi:hypothetical protein
MRFCYRTFGFFRRLLFPGTAVFEGISMTAKKKCIIVIKDDNLEGGVNDA